MLALPPRYEPIRRLGQGGGGEVWAVRDKINGRVLALKVLAKDAGDAEVMALVREAMALSGLEGLGVPQVVAFGTLSDHRRFMVRELVEGDSLEDVLEDDDGPSWIAPLASACAQLTVVHRAGLLHGDIKPANIIVGAGGEGTLVDLGLAAPWREGGTLAQGLTPKYAAPELLMGDPLTVRAEVYALGATLAEALARRGSELSGKTRIALARVAARATEETPGSRYPSIDELASSLRHAAGLPIAEQRDGAPEASPNSGQAADTAWPVVGLEGTAQRLVAEVERLEPGAGLAIEGARGSGRTTLARRLSWSLGVKGRAVAMIEAPTREAVELELSGASTILRGQLVIVDDIDALDEAGRAPLCRASAAGACLVAVGKRADVERLVDGKCAAFEVPPLDARSAEELVLRSMPSLPDALRAHLVARTFGRPGTLRATIRKLGGRAVVSTEDLDLLLDVPRLGSVAPQSMGRAGTIASIEKLLDMGRVDEAAQKIDEMGEARDQGEAVRVAVWRSRVALGRGDATAAQALLAAERDAALAGPHKRAWQVASARACLRAADYDGAVELTAGVLAAGDDDALAADAYSVRGVARALTGDDALAQESLGRALAVAKIIGDARTFAVALGSSAIAHQRAGRTREAGAAYEASLAAAEQAGDASTVAAMRLNLAVLARAEGDLARASLHLEAAVDLGRRAGGLLAVQQALLNLANLDLYLGRYARASASIESLAKQRERLSVAMRAQLLGLEAELATRSGDVARAAALYEQTAIAWEAQGRSLDAAESRLEGLLEQSREPTADPQVLARELAAVKEKLGDSGFREHGALAMMVRASVARLAGDEEAALRALDEALESARKSGQRDWAWQTLDARARLAASQGSVALARRDTEAALAMLEETAAKLPRDLREVFWNDPRRSALRQAHTATLLHNAPQPARATKHTPTGTTSLFAIRPAEDRLARILEITRELASEHDIARLLTRVTDHAIALLGAERGFVVLTNDKGELEAHAARAASTRTGSAGSDEPHLLFSRSVAEKVVETGEPVMAQSARDDERLASALSVHQLMIQSIACVPIRGAPPLGRTIGALYVETRLRPGLRFNDEMPTLCAFADQAAIAIENARLLSENLARAEELAHANAELAVAHARVSELLGKRTEQLAVARRDLKQVRAELRSHFGYGGLVGTSTAMRKLYSIIERIKETDVPVLITGESGTGKEMVAKAVHASGPRARKPFLGVNCGAIPGNLLESELFGSVRGAFTGADRDRKGLFREAEGGTILLDEIGEMPHKMQAGLLRVLQEKCVRPLGSATEEPVDARVIAATNRDLESMVKEGTFREDLFYRLNVVKLHVPALRERIEDIPPLIDHFLTLFAARYRRERKALARDALRRLSSFQWPGNVRQLEHVLLNAWLMSEADEIESDDLELPTAATRSGPMAAHSATASGSPSPRATSGAPARAASKEEYKATERDRILSALAACNWNRVQAAKMIGVPRRTFYRRLKEFGIV